METETSFGAWVRRRRKALDMLQKELADRVGCSVNTLQKIERDERRPSRQLAVRLAESLDLPPGERATFLHVARGERLVERLPAAAPPAESQAPAQPQMRLPVALTPLFGRELELIEIAQLLRDPQCRLLTLVGPGGMGKTRLALEAATQRQGTFAQGAVFVALAPATSHEQVISAIAEALGLVLRGASDRTAQLVAALREWDLLLVLDNFEQLLADPASVAVIGTLLAGVPRIKLLVTSREPLRLQPEWVFGVQGLPVPESSAPDALEASSAARLFLQRARQARVGLVLTPEERAAVGRICQLVEGLPLGIELAASWVTTLTCQEIAREIQRNLDFLAATARDVADRHRSIRAVFDQSWQLLAPPEQHALRRMAIFQGGFSREAAEHVAGASLATLAALVTKSLLRRAPTGRYDLHELVRQYLEERLRAEEQDHAATWQRYSEYYTGLLARQGPAFKGPDHAAVAAELATELANLRRSWTWAAEHGRAEILSRAADTLFWLYESRSSFREGVPLFGQAAEQMQAALDTAPSGADTPMLRLALGQALCYQGFCCWRQGQHTQARALLEQSHALLAELPSFTDAVRHAHATTTAFYGAVLHVTGEYREGRGMLEASLKLMRALGDRWGTAFCLRRLGLTAVATGEYAEAHQLLGESLALSRDMGNHWSAAFSLNFLSTVASALGKHAEAEQLLDEALALSRSMDDQFNIAMALQGLGVVRGAQGSSAEAARFFQNSLRIWREIGDQGNLAQTLSQLGTAALVQGDQREAQRCFHEALALARQAEVLPVALDALLGIGMLYAATHAQERALEIMLHIQTNPAATHATRTHAARLAETLAATLPPDSVEHARTSAHAKTSDMLAHELLAT